MGEGEDTALIVVFDSAMTKLTCVRAAEVVNPMVCAFLIDKVTDYFCMLVNWYLLKRISNNFRDRVIKTQPTMNFHNCSRTLLGIHTYSISSSMRPISHLTISPSPSLGSLTTMRESRVLPLHRM